MSSPAAPAGPGLRGLGPIWHGPPAPGAQGPRLRDVVLVAILALVATAEALVRTDLQWPMSTAAVTIVLLCGLLWRRSHPLLVIIGLTVISGGFELAQTLAGVGTQALGTMVALIVLPYALFRWGSGRARLLGGALLVVGLGVSIFSGGEGFAGAVAGIAFVGGACLLGMLRRERVLSRARELDHVRLTEREALARDLHDTVAHRVSAIAIRAQASRTVPGVPAMVSEQLDAVETEAQAALTEMRSLVTTLRADSDAPGAEYRPTPGLADLAALADPGPPAVQVRIDDDVVVPQVTASALFRIAQEGVTNARKHAATPSRITVIVTAAGEHVELLVHDDGASVASRPNTEGHGLRGMAERTQLLGGEFHAGPDPDGGWTLRSRLPVRSGV